MGLSFVYTTYTISNYLSAHILSPKMFTITNLKYDDLE